MTTYIHVNRRIVEANNNNKTTEPVITIRTDWDLINSNQQQAEGAVILDEEGNELARIVYMPEGSPHVLVRCWIETEHTVKAI